MLRAAVFLVSAVLFGALHVAGRRLRPFRPPSRLRKRRRALFAMRFGTQLVDVVAVHAAFNCTRARSCWRKPAELIR